MTAMGRLLPVDIVGDFCTLDIRLGISAQQIGGDMQGAGIGLKWVVAVLTFVSNMAHAQQPSIAGAWELVYVAPQAAMNTVPVGVTNSKLYFSEQSGLYSLAPDKGSIEGVKPVDYVFDGKHLKLKLPGALRTREMTIRFDDSTTMVMTQPYEAMRVFKRISSIETRLEPQSLQLVADGARSEDSRYDPKDYSKVALLDRVKGLWEVVAYDRVPSAQLPPYGFFNDIWKIDASTVTVSRREPAAQDTVPFALDGGKLASSGIGLGAPIGSRIEWTPSFNEWGQLVLDSAYCRVILKRTLAKADELAAFPLKVVVVHVGERN